MIVKHVVTSDGSHYGYRFHCPGCDEEHIITTLPYPGGWTFNGDEACPTFSPSIHVYPSARWDGTRRVETPRCHSFVTGGRIEFLGDCTHALAGKTVPLPEIPTSGDSAK
jgi:hypothetical protein